MEDAKSCNKVVPDELKKVGGGYEPPESLVADEPPMTTTEPEPVEHPATTEIAPRELLGSPEHKTIASDLCIEVQSLLRRYLTDRTSVKLKAYAANEEWGTPTENLQLEFVNEKFDLTIQLKKRK